MRKFCRQTSPRFLFRWILLLISLGISVASPQLSWTESKEKGRAAYHTKISMRDGVYLSADIYFPPGSGPFPTILSRTPYDNSMYFASGQQWASRGYVFVAQDCRGRYDSDGEWEWPLARTQWTKYYLHSQGKAQCLGGDNRLSIKIPEKEPPGKYDYDPANPVLNIASETFAGMGSESLVFPRDLQDMHRRPDVLIYETPPLEEDVEIIGPVTLELYASTSAPDTDWVARISDVFPDGTAWALCGTILRARFRES